MASKNSKQTQNRGKQTKKQQNKWILPSVAGVAVLAVVLIVVAIQSGNGSEENDGSAISNTANESQAISEGESLVIPVSEDNNGANDSQTINEGESLVIPVSEISETAQFYPLTVNGTRMEVVAVTAPDGTIRTAFNTCQVCNGSPLAYFDQQGNTLRCLNCGNRFPMNSVEIEAGGCNPVPIFASDKTVTDDSITVAYEILAANAYRFPENWKT